MDFPKQNQHIFFINNPKEVKAKEVESDEEDEDNSEEPKVVVKKHESEKEKYIK